LRSLHRWRSASTAGGKGRGATTPKFPLRLRPLPRATTGAPHRTSAACGRDLPAVLRAKRSEAWRRQTAGARSPRGLSNLSRLEVLDKFDDRAEVVFLIVVHLEVAPFCQHDARARNELAHFADVVGVHRPLLARDD